MKLLLFLSLLGLAACSKSESTAKAAGEPIAPPAIGVKLATATLRSVPVEI